MTATTMILCEVIKQGIAKNMALMYNTPAEKPIQEALAQAIQLKFEKHLRIDAERWISAVAKREGITENDLAEQLDKEWSDKADEFHALVIANGGRDVANMRRQFIADYCPKTAELHAYVQHRSVALFASLVL